MHRTHRPRGALTYESARRRDVLAGHRKRAGAGIADFALRRHGIQGEKDDQVRGILSRRSCGGVAWRPFPCIFQMGMNIRFRGKQMSGKEFEKKP